MDHDHVRRHHLSLARHLDQHHRHPRARRLHRRGRALAARPRRGSRRLRRRRRRRAADRDGLAPGEQVQGSPDVFRQQDGPGRSGLRPHRRHDPRPPRGGARGGAASDRRRGRLRGRHRPVEDEGPRVGRGDGRDLGDPGDPRASRTGGRGGPARPRRRRLELRRQRDGALRRPSRRSPPRISARGCARRRSAASSCLSCAGPPSRTRPSSPCSTRSSTTCRVRSTCRPPRESTPARGEPIEREPRDDEPFSALAFKIMSDPFVGKLTYLRVYSGTLEKGTTVLNSSRGPQGAHRADPPDARQPPRGPRRGLHRRHRRRRRTQVDDDR